MRDTENMIAFTMLMGNDRHVKARLQRLETVMVHPGEKTLFLRHIEDKEDFGFIYNDMMGLSAVLEDEDLMLFLSLLFAYFRRKRGDPGATSEFYDLLKTNPEPLNEEELTKSFEDLIKCGLVKINEEKVILINFLRLIQIQQKTAEVLHRIWEKALHMSESDTPETVAEVVSEDIKVAEEALKEPEDSETPSNS